ncbi:hypothetical protein [Psychroserpens sp. Hel_I_66]|uniref:hypothetical protein n=1 Tax=Psychroserpens sp. Hel_I_66 TaxID=1250004 RepID=UPI0006484C26|nr:hypothetical protein [Psychroserpens sp. Hel_I_66]
MKITANQIQDLYNFTRLHFVEHYDLQTELVDHLANDIEHIWEAKPQLPYEEAKTIAFKKFGVFGFMDVVSKRQKAMGKRYVKFLWHEFKEWFTLPKLLITVSIFIACYAMFSSAYMAAMLIISYSLILVWSTFKSIKLNRQFRRRKEKSNKKWMLEEMIFRQAGGAGLILISQLPTWYNISLDHSNSFWFTLGVSVFTTLFIIYMFVSLELLPNKAETLLNKTYPEFSL